MAYQALQKPPCITLHALCDFFRRALGNYFPASFASFGAQVYDPVCCFYNIKIVLYDNNRVAGVYKALQNIQEHLYVFKMEPAGWFVKNIEGFAGIFFGKLPGKLYSLSFPA